MSRKPTAARSSTPLPFSVLSRVPTSAALNIRDTLALVEVRSVEPPAPPSTTRTAEEQSVFSALREDSLALRAWRINALARRCYPKAFRPA